MYLASLLNLAAEDANLLLLLVFAGDSPATASGSTDASGMGLPPLSFSFAILLLFVPHTFRLDFLEGDVLLEVLPSASSSGAMGSTVESDFFDTI